MSRIKDTLTIALGGSLVLLWLALAILPTLVIIHFVIKYW